MISSGMNLVMTVIGFAVSTLFIVFICTRLICARIQHRTARRSFQMSSRSNLSTVTPPIFSLLFRRGLHGLAAPVLDNFPAKRYSDEYFSALEDAQCSVCLSDYRKEDILRILPHCGHYFHINCIDIWLLQNSTCPVCRVSLRETNEKKRSMPPLFSSRSHYIQSANIHTYQCLLTARGFPSSSQENPVTSPVQGIQSESSINLEVVAGETINPVGGNSALKESPNDNIESLPCV